MVYKFAIFCDLRVMEEQQRCQHGQRNKRLRPVGPTRSNLPSFLILIGSQTPLKYPSCTNPDPNAIAYSQFLAYVTSSNAYNRILSSILYNCLGSELPREPLATASQAPTTTDSLSSNLSAHVTTTQLLPIYIISRN